ncbi:MAG TPA: hypothetical protein VK139_00005, partial [Microbacteriaceae bacterium]|nr:hypothetical protein [Microbacteriaceae bacterium]
MSSAIVRVADLWHPWNWPARVIAGSFFAVQVIMAITAMVQMGVVGPNLLGLALFALSFVLVLGRWGNALPRRIAWTVCLLMLAVVAVLGP